MKQIKYLFFPLILLIFFLNSCERRDIYDLPTSKVHININWSMEKQKSEFFYVVFYPRDKSKPIIKNFIESDGGEISVPQGIYDVLIFSYDYEKIVVNPTNSFISSYATTNEINQNLAYSFKSNSNKVLNQTDEIFYISKYESLNIDMVERDYYIEMIPKNIIKKYEIRLMVDNPSSIYSAFATISGFSGSYLLAEQRTKNDNVQIFSDVIISDNNIIIPFCTFGLIPLAENTLNLRIKLTNDSIIEERFNLTDRLQPLQNGGLVIIDTIVKIPIVTSSGIGGTVAGWGDEEGVDIVL